MIHGTPQVFHQTRSIFIHVPKCAGTSIEKTLGGKEFGGHSTAQSIKKRFPKEWEIYYKFGIVREPISRFYSGYWYLKQRPVIPALSNHNIILSKDLDDYIQNYFLKDNVLHLWKQKDFICDNNKPLVDIYKFEDLERGWKEILMKLNQHYQPLPLMNKSKDYSNAISNESLMILRDFYKEDFEIFNY